MKGLPTPVWVGKKFQFIRVFPYIISYTTTNNFSIPHAQKLLSTLAKADSCHDKRHNPQTSPSFSVEVNNFCRGYFQVQGRLERVMELRVMRMY